jgi:hypothetical protein
MKKMILIISKLILAILISLVFVISPTNAQVPNLHIKLEVSKDGTHWYNYSGSEDPEGETLNCDPGDIVIIKVTLWNTGDVNAVNILGAGAITNSSYISSISHIEPDADHNTREFTEIYFDEFHNGAIDLVEFGSTYDDDEESMTAVLTLSDDFPEGQTIITGAATIDALGLPAGEPEGGATEKDINTEKTSFLKTFLTEVAYAQQGEGRYSQFRIAVNAELPATGANLK